MEEKLKQTCKDILFQITGKIAKEEDPDWQTVMYYLRNLKISRVNLKFKNEV
jgi:hypothetical protein